MQNNTQFPFIGENLQDVNENVFQVAELDKKTFVLIYQGKVYDKLSSGVMKELIFSILFSILVDFINELQVHKVKPLKKPRLPRPVRTKPVGLTWTDVKFPRLGAKIETNGPDKTIWSYGFWWKKDDYNLSNAYQDGPYASMRERFKSKVMDEILSQLGI